ncbi:MAG: chemotaxis protein CheW [Candidatus Kapabacteria bacterium]|nr:chemotaxis protein CheW [Candidatus Kapabacteria bacterium]
MANLEKVIFDKGPKCWNRIGIYGDNSCDLLASYDHCKNCPVYTEGGRKLFKREIPEELINEWTEQISSPKEIESDSQESLIVFRIADEWLAVKTVSFKEAVDSKFVHYVPGRTNDYLLGLTNVNGELLMCISLSAFLSLNRVKPLENGDSKKYKSLLVLESSDETYVIPVDEHYGVFKSDTQNYTKAPATITKSETTLTSNTFEIGDRTVSIIDTNRLFDMINSKLKW